MSRTKCASLTYGRALCITRYRIKTSTASPAADGRLWRTLTRPAPPLTAFRTEDPGPIVGGQVGGHHDGPPHAALAEYPEEQFSASAGESHESQLVDDQQAQTGKLSLQIQQPSLVTGLHEPVHQRCRGGEAHGHPVLAGGQTRPTATCALPLSLLPTATAFSRHPTYSQRAGSHWHGSGIHQDVIGQLEVPAYVVVVI